MNTFWLMLAILCWGADAGASVSAKAWGARGDGKADDTKALQRAFDAACREREPKLNLPRGTYRIIKPLETRCAMTIAGDGAKESIILQSVHKTLNHAIRASFSLRIEDVGLVTDPVRRDLGMVAVIGAPVPGRPAAGGTFTFVRFASSGFNFGMDLSGSSDNDLLSSIVVKDSAIAVSTEANAVSNPINAGNAEYLEITGSTLTGDQNNDHAIYTIGIRKIVIENNVIENHDNSAVKLLAGGFGPTATCPAGRDHYSSWRIANNVIRHSKLALAAYTYCAVELPEIVISQNRIEDIADSYAGDAAAMYIQANCESVIDRVAMSGNQFHDIGLSGVFLISSTQRTKPCVDFAAQGTIRSFTTSADTFVNWSISYPQSYFAISASGAHLESATVEAMRTDPQGHGRAALNLSAFREVLVRDVPQVGER